LLAKELKDALVLYAIDGFVAHEDIEPTKEWLIEIETALETCHGLVALLTRPLDVMRPTLIPRAVHHEGWVYEEKVDGYRRPSGLSAVGPRITLAAFPASLPPSASSIPLA
jgi:hypothetical protein